MNDIAIHQETGGVTVCSSSITGAWLKTLDLILHGRGMELSPFTLILEGFDDLPPVHIDAMEAIDVVIRVLKPGLSVRTASNTIFPYSIWKQGEPREDFYARFDKLWDRYISKCDLNRAGHYFRCLTSIRQCRKNPLPADGGVVDRGIDTNDNQLERVVRGIRASNARRARPHTGARNWQMPIAIPGLVDLEVTNPPFPCLQQVGVIKHTINGRRDLDIIAFYPTQDLVIRSYGNWDGLAKLGKFIALETDTTLRRVIVFAGEQKLNPNRNKNVQGPFTSISKSSIRPTRDIVARIMEDTENE